MELRKGMWVREQGRVGILARIGPAPGITVRPDPREKGTASMALDETQGEVHFTNHLGETMLVARVALADLVQANYRDIPVDRRPDIAFAASLGYR